MGKITLELENKEELLKILGSLSLVKSVNFIEDKELDNLIEKVQTTYIMHVDK